MPRFSGSRARCACCAILTFVVAPAAMVGFNASAPGPTGAAAETRECVIYSVYQSDSTARKGRSLSIGLLDVEGIPEQLVGRRDAIRTFATDRLTAAMTVLKYFLAVSPVSDAAAAPTDLHLEGVITGIETGSRWLRPFITTGTAKARLKGAIRTGAGGMLLDFECEGASSGGSGVVGLFESFEAPESLLRRTFDRFAFDLGRALVDLDVSLERLAKRPRQPVLSEGATGRRNKPWRKQAAGRWSPQDHSHEAGAFIVETQNRNWFRAHALWLSRSALASNTFLNETEFPDGKYNFADGLLPDLAPIASLAAQDVYLIGVTFESGATDGSTDGDEPPFVRNDQTLKDATSLARRNAPATRVAATDAISVRPYLRRRGTFASRWRNVPFVFAFPVRLSDGTPLVQSLADEIELRTAIDGRDVLVRFRLADFDVSAVDELLPQSR